MWKDERSYGERLATLTRNLRRRKGDHLLHISQEPASQPFLEPFKEVNTILSKISTGEIKTKPDHWTPVNKADRLIEDTVTVAAY